VKHIGIGDVTTSVVRCVYLDTCLWERLVVGVSRRHLPSQSINAMQTAFVLRAFRQYQLQSINIHRLHEMVIEPRFF
jgi:hypothetical protein